MTTVPIESEVKRNRSISQWIFNPFYYVAGIKALVIGITVILITGYLGFLENCRFDGILDFHFGSMQSPLWHCISEGFISWFLLSILLLTAGKIISKSRFRVIDVFGTQALARFPYVFVALVVIIPGIIPIFNNFAKSLLLNHNVSQFFSQDFIAFAFILIIILVMTIWMVALMYRAFRISCNVSGKNAVIAFIICLLIGEIISKVIILQLPVSFGRQIAVTTQADGLTSKANKFIILLSRDDYKSAVRMFNKKMKSALPEEKLKETWQLLQAQCGPFEAQGTVRKEKIQNYDIVYVTCHFEKISLNSKIVFDGRRMIAGLFFIPATNK
jgi:hypothetical protein